MNKRSSIDFELLIPLLIGGLSVVGIGVVLLIGYARNAPAEVTATPSATPFKYVYLGTEPAVTTLVAEGSETIPVVDTEVVDTEVVVPLVTVTGFSTPIIFPTVNVQRTNTPGLPVSTRTGTAIRAATATRTNTPGAADTYDDTHSRLTYTGNWIVQTGLPTSGSGAVYNGTLHISDVADSKSVTIQFSGQEIFFYFQSAPSYGIVTIYLDDDPLALTTVNEAQGGGVWHYVTETSQSHIIRIEHTGGGSVNIDKFVIPGATPTPTRTPTP